MPKHHLVPQMLLDRFAKDKRLAMVARTGGGPRLLTTVKNACNQVGFYRIETNDLEEWAREGHDPEQVEATFSGIEGGAVPLLDALCAGQMLERPEDRFRLGLFAALQACRGEGFRQDVEGAMTERIRKQIEAQHDVKRLVNWMKKHGLPHGPEDVTAFTKEIFQGAWRTVMPQSVAVQESLRFAVRVLLPELLRRNWVVIRFDDPLLLTSDSPVVPWSGPAPDWMPPVSWATAARIFFPLDRYTCLAFDMYDSPGVVTGTEQDARTINLAVATEARRWIYHHPDDTPLVGIQLPPPSKFVHEKTDVHPDGDALVSRGWLVKRPSPLG